EIGALGRLVIDVIADHPQHAHQLLVQVSLMEIVLSRAPGEQRGEIQRHGPLLARASSLARLSPRRVLPWYRRRRFPDYSRGRGPPLPCNAGSPRWAH